MKSIFISIFCIVITSPFLFGISKNKIENKKKTTTKGSGFALVELFTSEGCSSCPSADALIAGLSRGMQSNIFILSYHVDYWNRLGWKDKFSSPLSTQRQQDYVSHFGLNGAYTPQIVVNGSEEFIGSIKSKLYTSINKNIESNTTKTTINITATKIGNRLVIKGNTALLKDYNLCIALVQLNGSSDVKHGENKGKFLEHINIVQGLKTIDAMDIEKEINFSVVPNFVSSEHNIIAFLQHKESYDVLAAAKCAIN